LLHIIDISDPNFKENYLIVREELNKYSNKLIKKEEIVVLSKTDILSNDFDQANKEITMIIGREPFKISSFTGEGLDDLIEYLFNRCGNEND